MLCVKKLMDAEYKTELTHRTWCWAVVWSWNTSEEFDEASPLARVLYRSCRDFPLQMCTVRERSLSVRTKMQVHATLPLRETGINLTGAVSLIFEPRTADEVSMLGSWLTFIYLPVGPLLPFILVLLVRVLRHEFSTGFIRSTSIMMRKQLIFWSNMSFLKHAKWCHANTISENKVSYCTYWCNGLSLDQWPFKVFIIPFIYCLETFIWTFLAIKRYT